MQPMLTTTTMHDIPASPNPALLGLAMEVDKAGQADFMVVWVEEPAGSLRQVASVVMDAIVDRLVEIIRD